MNVRTGSIISHLIPNLRTAGVALLSEPSLSCLQTWITQQTYRYTHVSLSSTSFLRNESHSPSACCDAEKHNPTEVAFCHQGVPG